MTFNTSFQADATLAIAIAFGVPYCGKLLSYGELDRTDNFFAATHRHGSDDEGGAILGYAVRNRTNDEVEKFFRDSDDAMLFFSSEVKRDGCDREFGIVVLTEEMFVAHTQST